MVLLAHLDTVLTVSDQLMRWCASFELRWSPMLTYGTRRLDLLEWFDDNLDIVEFFESEDDDIGIGVGSSAQRLLVSDSGMTLLMRSPNANAGELADAVRGVAERLQPRGLRIGTYRSACSVSVALDYSEARERLAKRATGSLPKSVGEAFDCAVLFDARLPTGHAQVEFGVVSDAELRMRLMRPDMNRLAYRNQTLSTVPSQIPDNLPPVSLFFDVSWHTHGAQPEYVTEAEEVSEVVARVEEEVAALVAALKAGL